MRWVVGLGLRGHCRGAIAFASWLARHDDEEQPLQAAHVVRGDELYGLARRGMEDLVGEVGDRERFGELRVFEGIDVVAGLAEACRDHDADALVLGRRAARDDGRTIGLGRVVRRALRASPASIIVVPPDVRADNLGAGPIVVATDLRDDSLAGLAFAGFLARRLRRELQLVHVVAPARTWGLAGIDGERLRRLDVETREGAEQRLQAWAESHGAESHPRAVLPGDVVAELLARARATDALALVVGSRRLGVVGRLISASVGSALAASAPCPVAVVPPFPPAEPAEG